MSTLSPLAIAIKKSKQKNLDQWQEHLEKIKNSLRKLVKTNVDPKQLTELREQLKDAISKKGTEGVVPLIDLDEKCKEAIKQAANRQLPGTKQEQRDRFKAESDLAVDVIVAGLPTGTDLTAITKIMHDHHAAVPGEINVFGNYETIEDIKKIKEEKERTGRLKAIGKAMKAAMERKKLLSQELANVQWPKLDDNGMTTDEIEELKQPLLLAHSLVMRMTDHIPDAWLSRWTPGFEDRIANLAMTDEDKKNALQNAKDKTYSNEAKEKDVQAFRDFIEPSSTRKLERADFFFDQFTAPPDMTTRDENGKTTAQKIAEVQQELIKRAHEIRDLGGSIRDCKQVFDHIPRQWWPAEFLEEQQAWRKTERAVQRERVGEMFAKTESSKLATARGATEFLLELLGKETEVANVGQAGEKLTHGITGDDGKVDLATTNWANDEAVAKQLANYAGIAKDIYEQIKGWYKFYQDGEFGKLKEMNPKTIEEFSRKLADSAKTTVGDIVNISQTKGFPVPSESTFMAKVIPGLSIVAAGIDLALAIEKLASHAVTTHQTRTMKSDARERWAVGKDEDGGAFLNALQNEMGARSRQLAKDSVDVTTKSLGLSGSVMEVTGVGTAAGFAVKIVGKGIEYGGKLVFTSIDWSLASSAKKLLREAQAGNPIARVQIFENCGTYAKMYIALLVQDGHPLASKFIEQRGIEEGDLDEAMSLKILREAMLASADQKDELAFDAGEAYADTVGAGAVVKAGRYLKEKAKKAQESYRNRGDRNATSYDLKQTIGNVAITAAAWETAKDEAKKNHLYMEKTGIGEALQAVESKTKKPPESPEEWLAYHDALEQALGTIYGYTPVTLPVGDNEEVEPHTPLAKWLFALIENIKTEMQEADTKSGLSQSRNDFKPDPPTDLKKHEWKEVHKEAVKKAHLDSDDCGVKDALKELEKALADKDYQGNDRQKQRTARLAARDRYQEVIQAMKAYWVECGTCEGVRAWLNAAIGLAAKELRDLDTALFDVDGSWTCPTQGFTQKEWNDAWRTACVAGVVLEKKGDGGIGKALDAVEKQAKAYEEVYDSNTPPATPEGKLKAFEVRKKYRAALATLFANISNLVAVQKELVKGLNDYAKILRNETSKRLQEINSHQDKVDIGPAPTDYTDIGWQKFYIDAQSNGAIPRDSIAADLDKAMLKFAEELSIQKNAAKGPDRRAAGVKAKAAFGKVRSALVQCQGTYAHPTVAEYLVELGKHLDGQHNDIDKFLGGEDDVTTTFAAFTWDDKAWQTEKAKAVEAGLVDDSKTGLGKLLTESQKAFDTATKQNADPKDKVKAKELIEKVQALAKEMKKGTKNGNLTAYFKECVSEAKNRIAQLT